MTIGRFPTTDVERISHKMSKMPAAYLPQGLQLIHVFRESVTLKPAAERFRQGWRTAMQGETPPISELWSGIDVE